MIAAIVAVDNNFGIGFNGDLLEYIPDDLKRFKQITNNSMIIMGRKTWDSLPKKPLPNRFNVIITSQDLEEDDNINIKYSTMEEVKTFLELDLGIPIFIIGGGLIYRELLPYCKEVYLTRILKEHENVDTYFPNLDNMEEWVCENSSEILSYNDIGYQYQHYRRH